MKMDRKKLTGVIIFAGIFLVLTGCDKNSTHYEDKLTKESKYFDGELYSYKEYEYNADGLLEKMTEYKADGDFCSSVVYEYDDGLLINESLYYDQNDPYEVIKRKYDSKGRLVKEKYYHGIFVSKKNEYYYNHKGLLKKEKKWNYAGDAILGFSSYDKYKYEYDEDGNMESVARYNRLGLEMSSYSFEYDGHDNLTYGWGVTYYNEYDDLGNLVKVQDAYVTDPINVGITYTNGTVTNNVQIGGSCWVFAEHEYDGSGNVIHDYEMDDRGAVVSEIIYQYDSNKNILEKNEISNANGYKHCYGTIKYEYESILVTDY